MNISTFVKITLLAIVIAGCNTNKCKQDIDSKTYPNMTNGDMQDGIVPTFPEWYKPWWKTNECNIYVY